MLYEVITDAGFEGSEAKKMAMRLSASKEGNFEGHCIIRFADLKEPEWFEAVRPHLQKLRTPRPYPFIDRKVQTSWNAMYIKSLFALSVYVPEMLV